MSQNTCAFIVPAPSADGEIHRLEAQHGTVYDEDEAEEQLTTQRGYFVLKADVLEVDAEEARYLSGMFETVANALEDYHEERTEVSKHE